MSYKTILVHCDGDKSAVQRVAVAIDMARRFGGHLVGLQVQPPFTPPLFAETAFAMEPLLDAYQQAAKAAREAATRTFAGAVASKGLSSEWRTVDGPVDEQVIAASRCADLVVLGQADPENATAMSAPADLAETVAMGSGRPILTVPFVGAPARVGGTVLLCWNASRESAQAATAALPILQQATKVVVLVVDGRAADGERAPRPGADAVAWLGRHGIQAALQQDVSADGDVGAAILSRAADYSADLIVMGLYGHSRAREFILGGASRTLLRSMTVPVLMAH